MKRQTFLLKITALSVIISFFSMAFLILLLVPSENEVLYKFSVIGLALFSITTTLIYRKILLKIREFERNSIKIKIINTLSTVKLTEVLFFPKSNIDKKLVGTKILKNVNLKYFAKLNYEGIIEIFIKNQNNEHIHNFTISNYVFFNNHFKIK